MWQRRANRTFWTIKILTAIFIDYNTDDIRFTNIFSILFNIAESYSGLYVRLWPAKWTIDTFLGCQRRIIMKDTHCIAGCTYRINTKEDLERVLQTNCFLLIKTYWEIKPWWKIVFKRKLLYYEVMCIKSVIIVLDSGRWHHELSLDLLWTKLTKPQRKFSKC